MILRGSGWGTGKGEQRISMPGYCELRQQFTLGQEILFYPIFSREPQLSKRVCLSICPLVQLLVLRSIGLSVTSFFWRAETKMANNLCRVSGLVFLISCLSNAHDLKHFR